MNTQLHHDASPERILPVPFPARLLGSALVLLAVVFTGVLWSAFDTYHTVTSAQVRDLRLQELRGVILHLDEVLTMSARMAAVTGKSAWETRYRKFEPDLDAAVKEVLRLAHGPACVQAVSQTGVANAELVKMENQAFDLVRENQPDAAREVLFGLAYETQKKIYTNGMAAFIGALNDELATSKRRKIAAALGFLGFALGSAVLLLLTAWTVLRRLNRWRTDEALSFQRLTEAREALRNRQAQLSALQDSSPLGMFFTDAAGLCRYTNPMFYQITGVKGEEAGGMKWSEAIHPEDLEHVSREWKAASSMGKTFHSTHRFLRSGGEVVWASVNAAAVRENDQVTGFVGTIEDITGRKEAEGKLEEAHRRLVETSRQAGMAEVATGVLHNVGNVLTSVNVSATLLVDGFKKSRLGSLKKAVDLLSEHAANLVSFFSSDPRGRQLPEYLSQISEHLRVERETALSEAEQIRKNIEHIKRIVAVQQSYAKLGGCNEQIDIVDVVEDSLRLNASGLHRHKVQVVRDFDQLPSMTLDKHKVLQILVNLVGNAKQACEESDDAEKRITVKLSHQQDRIRIAVTDNGVGIPAENLTRIFAHGFTTKKNGHGFGLHSGALAAREMGGALHVRSDGPGRGAEFILELPVNAEAKQP